MTVPLPPDKTLMRCAPLMFDLLHKLEMHCQGKTGKVGPDHADEGADIRAEIRALLKEMGAEI
jgi:hypothetical protein